MFRAKPEYLEKVQERIRSLTNRIDLLRDNLEADELPIAGEDAIATIEFIMRCLLVIERRLAKVVKNSLTAEDGSGILVEEEAMAAIVEGLKIAIIQSGALSRTYSISTHLN